MVLVALTWAWQVFVRQAPPPQATVMLQTDDFSPTASRQNKTAYAHYRLPSMHQNSTTDATSSKPRFILHIGPHKTGTTSIQCAILYNSDILRTFAYIGKADVGLEGCRGVDKNTNKKTFLFGRRLHLCLAQEACMRRFKTMLQNEKQMGHNLVLSDEWVSFRTTDILRPRRQGLPNKVLWKRLLEILQQEWDLTIVVTYRRWFEWLPSVKNQFDRFGKHHQEVGSWPRSNLSTWKNDDSMKPPIFDSIQQYITNRTSRPYPYLDEVLQELDRHYPEQKVVVLNMHDKRGIVTAFLCDVIFKQQSPTLCTAGATTAAAAEPSHASMSHFYDMLGVAAWQRGWVAPNLTRGRVEKLIRIQHEQEWHKTPLDFPLVCPTRQQVLPILHQSIHYEKTLGPEFYNSESGGDQVIESQFWELAQ